MLFPDGDGTIIQNPALESTQETAYMEKEEFKDVTNLDDKTSGQTLPMMDSDYKGLSDNEMFGKYSLLDELGRGGMGIVYKAHDTQLNRDVALKIMLAGESASEEQVVRFKREAEAVAQINHPNVIPVFDVGQIDDKYYFTMEYIEGEPLNRIIKDGDRFKTREFIEIMQQVAEAISFCHKKNILHRDLKPANVIVDANNKPHVMDFGLAKVESTGDTQLTKSGVIMGTPAYMSPEQTESARSIDGRADIWSVGVMLYEYLTGEQPFQGETAIELLFNISSADPVPVEKKTKVHKDLNTITMKCLEKDPNNRYETCGELAKDLELFLANEPILATPPSTIQLFFRKIKKNKMVVTFLIVICLITYGAFYAVEYSGKESEKKLEESKKEIDKISQKAKEALEKTKAEIDKLAETIEFYQIGNIRGLEFESSLSEPQVSKLKSLEELSGAKEYFNDILISGNEQQKILAVKV